MSSSTHVPASPASRHLDRSAAKWRNPRIFLRGGAAFRLLRTLTLASLLVFLLGAVEPTTRFSRIGHQMMCPCGCAEILLECNHVGCPDSDRMIGELRGMLGTGGTAAGEPATIATAGMTDTSILNWFAAKYGATVLAAPIRGGFDNVAWIVPLALFFLATVGTAVVVRVWKMRSVPTPAPITPADPQTAALRARIRRETEY